MKHFSVPETGKKNTHISKKTLAHSVVWAEPKLAEQRVNAGRRARSPGGKNLEKGADWEWEFYTQDTETNFRCETKYQSICLGPKC